MVAVIDDTVTTYKGWHDFYDQYKKMYFMPSSLMLKCRYIRIPLIIAFSFSNEQF